MSSLRPRQSGAGAVLELLADWDLVVRPARGRPSLFLRLVLRRGRGARTLLWTYGFEFDSLWIFDYAAHLAPAELRLPLACGRL